MPGVSPNPAGRPKGSRNKLSEDFLSALQEDFAGHGAEAIAACREDDPGKYCSIVASILPKEFVIDRSTDGLSDADLALALEYFRSLLDSRGAGGGTTIEGRAEQVGELQALPQTD